MTTTTQFDPKQLPPIEGQAPQAPSAPPPAPASNPESADTTELTIRLKRPLSTHSGDIRSVTLRQPTAGDYIDLGKPPYYTEADPTGGGGAVLMTDFQRAGFWLAQLSGLDLAIIKSMGGDDYIEAATEMVRWMMNITEGVDEGN